MATGGGKGSARMRDEDDIVNAIEDALADDTTQFFDVDGTNDRFNGSGRAPLTEEEKEQLEEELRKTEDEISTLRQVLGARLKHSNELKRKLGITPWVEMQQEVSQGFKAVKETSAYQKTGEALQQASGALTKTFGQIRSSNTFKSFGDKVGSAYNSVKKGYSQAKIVASSSIDQLGGQGKPNTGGPNTQPTSPTNEKPHTLQ